MAEFPVKPPSSGKSAGKDSPFATLRQLKTRPAPRPAAPAPRPPEADDALLLQRELRGVTPLGELNRAEASSPRPAPEPRFSTRPVDDEVPDAPRRTPLRDAWLEAVHDVQRLPDNARVSPERLRATPAPEQPSTAPRLAPAQGVADPLLQQVFAGVQPLDPRGKVELQGPRPAPRPVQREEDERATLREALEAPLTFEDRLDMGDEPAFLQPGLRRNVLTDLRRGRWVIQGEIDLHGLNREEARHALASFLHRSLSQGQRCIRVIHGKGLSSPGRESILRQLSKTWLAQREEILAFCQARPHDGGEGALLVLLRAPRPRHPPRLPR